MALPQTIEIANLGMWDSLILMVMALVVFGPRRLPEIGRQIGRLMYEIRKASNDFKFQMEEELRKAEDADRQKKETERLAALALAAPAQANVESQPSISGVGVPAQDAQFPIPSPYPEEGVYPNLSPAEYQLQESAPRIQPPSSGEPVPAAKPASPAESTVASQTAENLDTSSEPYQGTIAEQANHG